MAAGGMNIPEVFAVTFVADRTEAFIGHNLGKADDGIERGPDLVADPRKKIGLRRRGCFPLALGLGELLFRLLPSGNVAKDGAQLVGAVADPPRRHEKRDLLTSAGKADDLAAIE